MPCLAPRAHSSLELSNVLPWHQNIWLHPTARPGTHAMPPHLPHARAAGCPGQTPRDAIGDWAISSILQAAGEGLGRPVLVAGFCEDSG